MNSDMKKYKLGIVLSGGGSKGFAHLGVLQALIDRGIIPDVIAGTSAGAFAGALFADGNEPNQMLTLFKEKSFTEFAQFSIPKGGVFKSAPFKTFLEKNLKARTFEDLKIPLNIVTTNIENGKIKVFNSGPLIPCIIASCSVPIIFQPVEIDKNYYVDGGLLKKFPVSVIREFCEIIIGVNVCPTTSIKYKNTLSYIAERSFHYMSNANMLQDKKLCDYLIESDIPSKYGMFDLKHVKEIFDKGDKIAFDFLQKHEKKLKKDFPSFK
ncbi:patatin-like phospholipase family protein [Apibacter adventoris]|uniref:Phospholipase n=1 Tax=Apibacter adventoris TaxID=1679466 RepID=A0A2S8AGG0_9FLAO|nr:patatin-like phospholipase family protein [Apibacter adventoris]PQL95464.1 phospholipase [Apibacter adventoris]